jgi:predicted lipoprotein with Yx(FWY)xxD motif
MVQRTLSWMALAGAVVLALPGMAMAEKPKANDGMVVDSKGMTLYTYSEDTADKSACYDKCAQNWPPALVSASDTESENGDWTILTRTDGKKQWVLMGSPLYTFVGDKKKGDATGDGKADGKWATATMDGAD